MQFMTQNMLFDKRTGQVGITSFYGKKQHGKHTENCKQAEILYMSFKFTRMLLDMPDRYGINC